MKEIWTQYERNSSNKPTVQGWSEKIGTCRRRLLINSWKPLSYKSLLNLYKDLMNQVEQLQGWLNRGSWMNGIKSNTTKWLKWLDSFNLFSVGGSWPTPAIDRLADHQPPPPLWQRIYSPRRYDAEVLSAAGWRGRVRWVMVHPFTLGVKKQNKHDSWPNWIQIR